MGAYLNINTALAYQAAAIAQGIAISFGPKSKDFLDNFIEQEKDK